MAKSNSDDYTLADFLKSKNCDPFEKAADFTAFLDDWKKKGTYSYHRLVTSACTNRTTIRDPETQVDRDMIVLASNNYLGLSTRSEPVNAARKAVADYGTGLCGSRFLSGTYELVEELERQLADFEGREEALVFTTGYQANVGTISALMRPGDIVFIDRLCHASIVDGCRMAGCMFRTFRHNSPASLSRLLSRSADKYKGKLIVVDGIFSMEGDIAPLPEIAQLARKYGARLMVDEAHATGVVGPTGRGTVEHYGLHDRIDIILGTFSKSLAATGGYIAATREVITYVRHYGRSYMFSASPTPATVASVLSALSILRTEPQLRERLWSNIHYVHARLKSEGFDVLPDPPMSAILTIPIGTDSTVRAMSRDLYDAGVFVSSVAYPGVPLNEGRLRISLSAALTRDDLDRATAALVAAGAKHGILDRTGPGQPLPTVAPAQ